ncbi:MAG: prepilin-type N-terminal cleavage/methylation domain-containing protein [Phycisphaeraceae bacterium]|nr:prepilin-type N-terminal cleavage/methylation domain-containing protein [Phycisphaeraceae bacterium]
MLNSHRFRAVSRRAYTLVEVLIVVTLLGIASALVIPNVNSTEVLRVQSTVRAIVADITFAQSDALARQQGRAVIFDAENNAYAIVEVKSSSLNPATDTIQRVDLRNKRKFHDSTIESVNFDGGNVLVFDEMGGTVTAPASTTPSAGGSLVISGSGSRFRIAVEAYTGRVTVTRL